MKSIKELIPVLFSEHAMLMCVCHADNCRHSGALEHVGVVAQNFGECVQARNAKSKGGQSATNCHAYGQYLFSVPVVATVDLDAPDAYLVDPGSKWQSRWLLANTTVLRLPPGEKFYEESQVPRGVVPNEFPLFAQTVKRRRAQAAVSPPNP